MADFPPIPRRTRGRKTEAKIAAERAADETWAMAIENLSRETGFRFGPRGWGYYLEGLGHVTKDEFDLVEGVLSRLRKDGVLDPDVIPDDDSRQVVPGEVLQSQDPDAFARGWVDHLDSIMARYTPVSFWEGLEVYVEVSVEKKDLLQIFGSVCDEFCVTMQNIKGNSDLNTLRRMLNRMAPHHDAGRQCILLHFGDHDPKGIEIAHTLQSALSSCNYVQGVEMFGEDVEVVRAGLTREQIDRLGLLWIDNLITGSGKDLADPRHPDAGKDYVTSYIRDHGPRKVEANALVARPDHAAALLRDQLMRLVPEDWPDKHQQRLAKHRDDARAALVTAIAEAAE